MKVLHVSYGFPPDPPGGTERYVEALALALRAHAIESVIVAPGAVDETYTHEGLLVRRFRPGIAAGDLETLYGNGDARSARAVEDILDDEAPDVLHQHALTPACSLRVIRAAKTRGIPVVFTYHTPTVTCQRGSLLEWGDTPCDGRVTVTRCTACSLHGLGASRSASRLLASTPAGLGDLVGRAGRAGGAWTALRMSSLMRRRLRELEGVFSSVDRFVALAPWVRNVLVANGVPSAKIVSSAHGLCGDVRDERPRMVPQPPLRVAHLGRLDPLKGTDVLIAAVRGKPSLPIELDIFGVAQSAGDDARLERFRALAEGDERIHFCPPIPSSDVIRTLAAYHLVAVPSQTLETGPLVILEAFAAGVPVIGSAVGGIVDKVRHDIDGLLVARFESAEAWGAVISRCVTEPGLVDRLQRGIRVPRRMDEVASEMSAVYSNLVPMAAVRSLAAAGLVGRA